MNAKLLSKIIEVDDRVNTICKCLVLGEVDHFQVEYSDNEVSITAYCHNAHKNDRLADLMRIYAKPTDKIQKSVFEQEMQDFWTSEITISL